MEVILQRGIAMAGQSGNQLALNVALLNFLVTLEHVEVGTEVTHELQVGLSVSKVGHRQLVQRYTEMGWQHEPMRMYANLIIRCT